MVKTKVLSVTANPNERVDSPKGFGLVAAIERAISLFLEEVGGEAVSFDLAGPVIDAHAGNVHDPDAVFGRTLVVLKYEASKAQEKKK